MNVNVSHDTWGELTMESLSIPPGNVYPAFVFVGLSYGVILACNLLVLTTIAVSASLHRPMFTLLLNLSVSDMIGATAFYPQLLGSILSRSRSISHPACLLQAVLLHIYGSGNMLFLAAMAYDRYIAICLPLRYNSIMTLQRSARITASIWLAIFAIYAALFALVGRFKICRTKIVDVYCNNPSLVKLACGDTSANNIYGLILLVAVIGGPLVLVVYTYVRILVTCAVSGGSQARGKALQTCGTHLIVFLVLQINTVCTLTAHRLNYVSPNTRRFLGVSVLIFPPIIDPLIYGLNTKEIRINIVRFLRRACLSRK